MLGFANPSALLRPLRSCCISQIRNTFVLRRKFPPRLSKKGGKLKPLKAGNYIYELVEDTEAVKQPDIKVILTSYVEGVGNKGDVVSVRPNFARNQLLLPGLAVYASPENLEAWKSQAPKEDSEQKSSPFVPKTIRRLSRLVLAVVMNQEVPWTLEKWHLRVSLRKAGVIAPENAIELPPEPITGPDMSKENKEFAVFLTINGKERVPIRCRIHHWHPDPLKRIPTIPGWFYQEVEPLFPHQAELLKSLPRQKQPKAEEDTTVS